MILKKHFTSADQSKRYPKPGIAHFNSLIVSITNNFDLLTGFTSKEYVASQLVEHSSHYQNELV